MPFLSLVAVVVVAFLSRSVLLLLQVLTVLGDFRPVIFWELEELLRGLSILSGLLVLCRSFFLLLPADSLLRRVRMLCLPLTASSSWTGLKRNGGGSRGLSTTGLSSPYFLKNKRHSVHRRALSLPAWCQSFDVVVKQCLQE